MKMIRIKYFKDIDTIKQFSKGDWIDLRCAEDVEMGRGQYKVIRLGIAMQLPEGYEAIVAPRSSTFSKYGIIMTNSIGVIDELYCGDEDEWGFPAYATHDIRIPFNTRIAQFRIIQHQTEIFFKVCKSLGNENRGGFGSTGEM